MASHSAGGRVGPMPVPSVTPLPRDRPDDGSDGGFGTLSTVSASTSGGHGGTCKCSCGGGGGRSAESPAAPAVPVARHTFLRLFLGELGEGQALPPASAIPTVERLQHSAVAVHLPRDTALEVAVAAAAATAPAATAAGGSGDVRGDAASSSSAAAVASVPEASSALASATCSLITTVTATHATMFPGADPAMQTAARRQREEALEAENAARAAHAVASACVLDGRLGPARGASSAGGDVTGAATLAAVASGVASGISGDAPSLLYGAGMTPLAATAAEVAAAAGTAATAASGATGAGGVISARGACNGTPTTAGTLQLLAVDHTPAGSGTGSDWSGSMTRLLLGRSPAAWWTSIDDALPHATAVVLTTTEGVDPEQAALAGFVMTDHGAGYGRWALPAPGALLGGSASGGRGSSTSTSSREEGRTTVLLPPYAPALASTLGKASYTGGGGGGAAFSSPASASSASSSSSTGTDDDAMAGGAHARRRATAARATGGSSSSGGAVALRPAFFDSPPILPPLWPRNAVANTYASLHRSLLRGAAGSSDHLPEAVRTILVRGWFGLLSPHDVTLMMAHAAVVTSRAQSQFARMLASTLPTLTDSQQADLRASVAAAAETYLAAHAAAVAAAGPQAHLLPPPLPSRFLQAPPSELPPVKISHCYGRVVTSVYEEMSLALRVLVTRHAAHQALEKDTGKAAAVQAARDLARARAAVSAGSAAAVNATAAVPGGLPSTLAAIRASAAGGVGTSSGVITGELACIGGVLVHGSGGAAAAAGGAAPAGSSAGCPAVAVPFTVPAPLLLSTASPLESLSVVAAATIFPPVADLRRG